MAIALLIQKNEIMINNFLITANPVSNVLKIVLDGIFMKSEVELALLLIKNEKMKLRDGFNVFLDLKNFQSKGVDFQSVHYKIQQLLTTDLFYENKSVSEVSPDYSH